MKKLLNLLLFLPLLMGGCYSSAQVYSNNDYGNNGGDISYQTFYDQLQPYGNWIEYPEYGYVWQPNAVADFRPYETNGHWVSTTDGWAWASDYDWGWAPFHYGRWLFDPAVGWLWVPGYEWAPAWVTWGQYNDYYAWAPLAPGISISIGSTWRAPYNYWSVIPRNYIQYSNPSRYDVRNNFNRNVINNFTIINNYNSYNNRDYYHRGPDYREVQRYTHQTINPLAIAQSQRPGVARVSQRQYQVYRPAVLPNSGSNNRNYAPSRVRTIDEVSGNGGMRRPGADNGNYRENTINRSANPNNGDLGGRPGTYGNGRFDNGATGGYNNQNNTPRNADQGGNNPITERTQRVERMRQMSGQTNPSQPPVVNPAQPQTNPQAGAATPQERRYQQRPWGNQQNSADRAITAPAQPAQPAQQFPNQRPDRMQQYPRNAPSQNNNQNAPVYQDNRNMQRNQKMPQQNNNPWRGQSPLPSQGQRPMPARPAAPERNMQQMPQRQNSSEQHGGGRGRERT